MNTEVRAIVAYIAGLLLTGKKSTSVLDHTSGKQRHVSSELSENTVNVFDHDLGCYIGGDIKGTTFSLFHHGHLHHIDLNIDVDQDIFEGFDYGASCHFSGTVSNDSIKIFDFAEGNYFEYSI